MARVVTARCRRSSLRDAVDVSALWGTIVGGAIALSSTVVIDWLRHRRSHQYRWDQRGFDELRNFIADANLAIGAMYDRGRALQRYGPDSDTFDHRKNAARVAYDKLRVSEACALMSNPALRGEIAHVKQALERIKAAAERGFDSGMPEWDEGQEAAVAALEALVASASGFYGVRDR